ncbi:fungal specific transcription factor domain-containing protein [Colletotrichum scovillei]|uniref:Fungal specific transcription factor domain-containing protein n=1 Tax=Colletotrichum scovillei TaxID=1209932 RepID=A0A9P7R013_9PEZI|nr:fungal specific transcription factor domain-containing protein [Colletotrichum scovillei]KAF4784833.1 fungal specific transcription factor domain-containing protein [Colletotrichum scovillei]KAG7044748.1 fungal specific transcription factor domain-containing protein [Colletotrichum scovillei]KAG7049458.1 fungal specific transcription factor domain-containing protein [Colletotrichum scovillei]KAG7064201.1 fungal specific transcription factor domain-containing protein [Colletotrichum scovillei
MTPPASSATAARQQSDQNTAAPGNSGTSKQQLSCANCRHRKIKCDKLQPRCKQCERSDLDCVFPSRKRNRKPRQGRQNELLNRITRLESIVSKVDSGNVDGVVRGGGTGTPTGSAGGAVPPTALLAAAVSATPHSISAAVAGRRGVGGDSVSGMNDAEPSPPGAGWDSQPAPPTNYMSAEFWENLCQEVEGMRQALDQPSDSEGSDDEEAGGQGQQGHQQHQHSTTSPESSTANKGQTPPALSGLISSFVTGGDEPLRHPPRDHIMYMCGIFFSNVDPAFKVIHRPTVSVELEGFANAVNKHIDDATEALFFSMYYGAVTSLTNEACLRNLGEERSVLAQRYREGVERALHKADYLNSTEIRTLQALTYYVCFLRSHNASRASWALIPLVVRLAQALHLHRDGVNPPLPPFEAEMRRRLWWMIVVLDIRAAEDRGTDAAIPRQSYNTRLPFNLDDDDFGPGTTDPLEDRTGPTEMTFCLCTSMSSGIFGNLRPRHPQLALDNDGTPEPTTSEDEIMAHAQRLEALFGTAPAKTPASDGDGSSGGGGGDDEDQDTRHLPANHAAVTVRIIILKMWLSAQYPFTPRASTATAKPRVARETMLRTAVNTIELVEYSSATYRERFGWWIDSYVQWHPLAVALAELCVQTRGELVERAWRVVDRNFHGMRERIADTRRGTLWRPLKKLLRRARAARAEAMMGALKLGDGGRGAPVSAAAGAATEQQGAARRTVEVPQNEEEEEEDDDDEDGDDDGDGDVDVTGVQEPSPTAAPAVGGHGVSMGTLHPAFRTDRIGGNTANASAAVSWHGGGSTLPPTSMPFATTNTVGLGGPTPMAVDPSMTAAAGMPASSLPPSTSAPMNPPFGLTPEDMAMFGGTPLFSNPQDLIAHFGIQMDAGDFGWDPSSWDEFVVDANMERSPGDDG